MRTRLFAAVPALAGGASSSSEAAAGGAAAEAGKTEAEARTPGPGGQRLESQSTGTAQSGAQTGGAMGEEEIRSRLRDQGFADVTDLRLEGEAYQATAMKDGKLVTLQIDPKTGQVIGSE